ncbi:small multidrug efflux protein [Agromyces seonyuensis]|uniref:Small multidrug efflux protein n=1 Tax=Agromyces seonyuensis TaxID=2662446 RepID=A0A6I4P382_9MICO|nr:small multidrug efflux protein [Agromyces seonyuensis]MWB97664.1 small multidrug efflux protein [Agromyces seonyuensis]
MSNPYEGFQDFVTGLPDLLQPLIVAVLAAIPYVEGEGAAALGIIAGIPPIVAALAAVVGNSLAVLGVVMLTSRARDRVVARRAGARRAVAVGGRSGASADTDTEAVGAADADGHPSTGLSTDRDAAAGAATAPTRKEKGRRRVTAWLVRFGVPGASILAPLALPTMLTASVFVASGVDRRWVMLWQVVAIVLWTGLVTAAATGLISLLGW